MRLHKKEIIDSKLNYILFVRKKLSRFFLRVLVMYVYPYGAQIAKLHIVQILRLFILYLVGKAGTYMYVYTETGT